MQWDFLALTQHGVHLPGTSRGLIDGSVSRCVILSAAATVAGRAAAPVYGPKTSQKPSYSCDNKTS